MREIKDLGDTLRGTIQKLRTDTAKAKENFAKEVSITQSNLAKVNSFASEMKDANKEVEALLADTGSNFPDVGELSGTTQASAPDKNGVTINKG